MSFLHAANRLVKHPSEFTSRVDEKKLQFVERGRERQDLPESILRIM